MIGFLQNDCWLMADIRTVFTSPEEVMFLLCLVRLSFSQITHGVAVGFCERFWKGSGDNRLDCVLYDLNLRICLYFFVILQ